MIWATVSSRSCFCWLYRASPSLAAKNIISLISVLTIWWCPCVESSLVLWEEGVCYYQCVLLAKLHYLLPCFILHSKDKFACYSRCFLTSYFCIPVPYNEKDIFWGVSSERSFTLLLVTNSCSVFHLGPYISCKLQRTQVCLQSTWIGKFDGCINVILWKIVIRDASWDECQICFCSIFWKN